MKRLGAWLWRLAPHVPAFKETLDELRWLRQENHFLREELRRKKLPPAPVPPVAAALGVRGLCEVMNPGRYEQVDWLALHADLERYALDRHCFQSFNGAVYRKGWEWTHCVYGLRELGMLQPHHRALGVGAGRECVIFYLADHIAQVTATDLYGAVEWSGDGGKEADPGLLEQAKDRVPATVDFTRIRFETRDGTNLGFADNSFDLAWSLSSIEHFGGHQAAHRALQELGRVVRPGGVVAVATEFVLLEEHEHPEYFTRSQILALAASASPTMELIGDINFDTLTYEYLVDSIALPAARDRKRRHVVLNDGDIQWTSVMLFFRKKER